MRSRLFAGISVVTDRRLCLRLAIHSLGALRRGAPTRPTGFEQCVNSIRRYTRSNSMGCRRTMIWPPTMPKMAQEVWMRVSALKKSSSAPKSLHTSLPDLSADSFNHRMLETVLLTQCSLSTSSLTAMFRVSAICLSRENHVLIDLASIYRR